MNTKKYKNMIGNYKGFRGEVSMGAVREHIPSELFDRLTGKELGLVMSAIDKAYHTGRKSTGAEVIDGCDLWACNKMVPLRCIEAITSTETKETITHPGCAPTVWRVIRWSMPDIVERS